MFGSADEYFVPFAEESAVLQARGQQVATLGGAGGEDDFGGLGGAYEGGHGGPGRLVFLGRIDSGLVHRPMEVGVVPEAHFIPLFHHLDRSERGGSVVQIDKLPAVNLLSQLGELRAYLMDVHKFLSETANLAIFAYICVSKDRQVMIDYISGKVEELTPTQVVIDNDGIGYRMEISLQSYAYLEGKKEARVYVQVQVNSRDGSEVSYGFANKDERALFQLITSVSGMGAASARMVLSSLSAEEFRQAVLAENVALIKSIKGIGLKTAQRLVLELKDKIVDGRGSDSEALFSVASNEVVDEASSALVMLGFNKANVQKAIQQILKSNPTAKVEDIIKAALKML